MGRREAGVLLHISSLPSRWGVGDIGEQAMSFAKMIRDCGISIWQMLPLNRTSSIFGNSPYSPLSAFSGEPLYIDPTSMIKEGYIDKADLPVPIYCNRTSYKRAREIKENLLRRAYEKKRYDLEDFHEFCSENNYWIDDYSLFFTLKNKFNLLPWNKWPKELKFKEHHMIKKIKQDFKENIDFFKFKQYIFFSQYKNFRSYCDEIGLKLVGDIPIYVTYDSPDVWGNPHLFQLNSDLEQDGSAGVPPDYYSKEGQLWGNPLYRWEEHEKLNFKWWMERLRQTLTLYDIIRIDHFIGLINYWSIPSGQKTAKEGKWMECPSTFFNVLKRNFPNIPFWAEDLGIINKKVEFLRDKLNIPGMTVLQFAFDDENYNSPYLPHNHSRDKITYIGTHDNDTTRGWFKNRTVHTQKNLQNYIGRNVKEDSVTYELIRMALQSVSDVAIVTVQDILNLDSHARMNTPSISRGNWAWRLREGELSRSNLEELSKMLQTYGRVN